MPKDGLAGHTGITPASKAEGSKVPWPGETACRLPVSGPSRFPFQDRTGSVPPRSGVSIFMALSAKAGHAAAARVITSTFAPGLAGRERATSFGAATRQSLRSRPAFPSPARSR